jgi:hypothetical protein
MTDNYQAFSNLFLHYKLLQNKKQNVKYEFSFHRDKEINRV